MLSGKCSSAGFATAWRKWPLSEAAAEAARCYGPDDGTTIITGRRARPRRGCACSRSRLAKFRARGELHLDGRPLTVRGFDPDAAAVHLLGDGEPEASAALSPGVGIVDLMQLLEDARAFAPECLGQYPHADRKVAIDRLGGDASRRACELDGVALPTRLSRVRRTRWCGKSLAGYQRLAQTRQERTARAKPRSS